MTNKLFIIVLAGLCLGIYAGYLGNDFVFDDQVLVEQNPLIKSAKLLPAVFKTEIYEYWSGPQSFDRMYRPLQMLSYFLDYRLWGNLPAGFRLTNLFLHLINAVLVFYLLSALFKNRLLAQCSSILFLVHPVQISVVAYISSRGDILSGLFILAACILFLRFLDGSHYLFFSLSLLASLGAFLSRENAIFIGIFLALVGFYHGGLKRRYGVIAGFLALTFFYFVLRLLVFGGSGLALHPNTLSGLARAVNGYNLFLRYVFLLLFPHDLGMFHTTPFIHKITALDFGFLVCGLFVVAVFLSFWKRLNLSFRILTFGSLWFILGLLPAYFYFDAYPALGRALMAESWLYLPSIGFLVIAVSLGLSSKTGKLILLALTIIFGFITAASRADWRNNAVFYERITRFLPDDNIIQKNLAAAYIQDGDFDRAVAVIRRLEKYYPDTPVTEGLWGQYYLARGSCALALEHFNRILVKNFFTNYLVSLCYAKMHNLDQSIAYSRLSLKQNGLYRPNIIHLAMLLESAGQTEESGKFLLLAQELDPKQR